MGFHKFLYLHFIPSCFRLLGNLRVVRPVGSDAAEAAAIKVVTSDGQVKTYHCPVPVANLMAEFPKHLVCRSDAFYIGRKIPALSEHDRLEPGHNYFLLPNHFFQSVLTFVTVASFVASRSNGRLAQQHGHVSSRKTAACRPFDIMRTPSGCLRIHVSDEFISQLVEDGKGQRTKRLCSTPQLEKDYERLVEGSRTGRWKPILETITECRKQRKRRKNHYFHLTKPSSSRQTKCRNEIL